MKRLILSFLILAVLINPAQSKTLRMGLKAELIGNDMILPVIQAEFLMPSGDGPEIFTGPYTVRLTYQNTDSGRYNFRTELFGLGPQYHISEYNFILAPNENMLIPLLPVKEGTAVNYIVTLIDDTSTAKPYLYPLDDTALWGISETIHYRTNWVKGSLIDFTWNKVMGYLEFIYNKYRESYRLSEFEKIDTYIHPEATDEIYLDSGYFYSVQPKRLRIDLVYGHSIKVATPAPACELLIYRKWGYGPRWMVTGLANYYNDNMLEIREYIKDIDQPGLLDLLKSENRVRNDTGSVISGALVFWLLQNESFMEFKNLYIQSTSLDFPDRFEDIYKYSFIELLDRFLDYAGNYKPAEGELDYYASLFFDQGNMVKAGKYYKELSILGEGDRAANLEKLAACEFWLGNYAAADTLYDLLLELGDESAKAFFMKGEVKLARGNIDDAVAFYKNSYEKGFSTGNLRTISILIDKGEIDSANVLLNGMPPGVERLLEFSVENAGLKIIHGEDADSLLDNIIRRAINESNKTPHDPRPYTILGKAYALANNYDTSMYYFNTAYFLEACPFFQSFILLEMGKTEDLLGDRERATNYYRQIIELDGGEYQKMMAKRYLNEAYRRTG